MLDLQIAARNLLRNGRRSLITIFAIVIGMVALLLFGGYIASIYYGVQTGIVRDKGHLHIYPQGYMDYGFSRPADFYIKDYAALIDKISTDPFIKDKLLIATPIVNLTGIAGNYPANTSTTFIGVGVRPTDHNRMRQWDAYHLQFPPLLLALAEDRPGDVVIGYGMARMLNLCRALAVPDCIDKPVVSSGAATDAGIQAIQEFAAQELENPAGPDGHNSIDLLAATATGAPNAITVEANAAQRQGVKVLDEAFVAMHLSQAQRLVYGDQNRVSAIILQLHDTKDMAAVQARLKALFAAESLPLEVKNYTEFSPEFTQIINMFMVIFSFMAIVIVLVVLFTIVNTLTMTVMERTAEIGSLRALGLRRSGVRRLFLLEGAIIGLVGSSTGLVLALVIAYLFNNAGYTWTPPNSAITMALQVLPFKEPALLAGVWLVMVLVAAVSSLLPARRAAHMNIVAAIRHV